MGASRVRPTTAESVPPAVRAIAVDGPSGSGKSTVSRALATSLGWRYLDTGACYRALTVAALDAGIVTAGADRPPGEGLEALAEETLPVLDLSTDPAEPRVLLGGTDVTRRIRDEATTRTVSAVSADPRLRRRAVAWQRAVVSGTGGCVAEGRDVGTVVLPDAPLKVWLTAEAGTRAGRRAAQERGDTRTVAVALDRRDRLDAARTANPAFPARDAVVVDTTGMDVGAVLARLLGLAAERGLAGSTP